MANERLRTALLQRGLTQEDLAEAVGVDPKTIERWVRGRVPYRKHRYKVASKLGVDEAYLWPGALADSQVLSASESEVLVLYPHRWAVPHHTWGQLFDGAESEIDILVFAGMFLVDDLGLLRLLESKVDAGVRLRVLLGDPDAVEVKIRGRHEGIDEALAGKIRNAIAIYQQRGLTAADGAEFRLHSTVLYNSIYRADGEMLVNSHIFGTPAADAPVMHLRQIAGGTLVSTYRQSFERVWAEAHPLD
jgi:transcriptional regulator with XRE-family HTH domain